MFGITRRKADCFSWIAASAASFDLSSSPMPPTSASTADASSPLPLSMPTCLESELRLPCNSSVRDWIVPALVLEQAESGLVEDEAAAFQARDGGGKVLAKQLDVEHAVILASSGHFLPRGSACTASSAFSTLASDDVPPT